jgi:hypothetical protein
VNKGERKAVENVLNIKIRRKGMQDKTRTNNVLLRTGVQLKKNLPVAVDPDETETRTVNNTKTN